MTDTATSGALEALLDDFLDGAIADLEGPPQGQDQADRLLWALRSVRRRKAEVQAVAKARIDQVKAWLAEQEDSLDSRAHYLEGVLEGWAQAQHEDSGRKTWKLPAGDLKVRPRMVKVAVDPAIDALGGRHYLDTAAAIEALVPAAVHHTTILLPGEVKKVAVPGKLLSPTYTGDVPAGCEARTALVKQGEGDDAKWVEVPGIVLYTPLAGRDGRTFSAVTK